MKVGDIVRIVTQPGNQWTHLVDEVGYIEEIAGPFASIETFTTDGRGAGMGTVPLICLKSETGAIWVRAKRLLDEERERYQAKVLDYDRRFKEMIAHVATKYKVTSEVAYEIYVELDYWKDQQNS